VAWRPGVEDSVRLGKQVGDWVHHAQKGIKG
jgi:hypothetical protein